ncbi:conserved hypothetical protein [Nostocoides japonicum T1-X7]|uniref:Four-carbon acid sugar kinase family protein n=1 Tax=Nostocoides japonicum T1-X7 TaxID=1194083 RepID=A0A077LUI2_9MICO|nr:four-carbon acid sugar kinase family protein [Tetrasphaera japonica]CCH76312.1 conserved hypothetical protein [Tetrasphaera japonica T1-X7]
MSRTRPHLVVIDDDPTGSQTVRGARLLLDLDLVPELPLSEGGVTFVLTNSRSLDEPDAAEVTARVGHALARRAEPHVVVSRGDSTLRGHTILEVDTLMACYASAGMPFDGVIFAPAFFEAGRRTVEGVHEVLGDGVWRPVGDTGYARDATFGFRSSRLPDYLQERSHGRVDASGVVTVTLDDIAAGVSAVASRIAQAPPGSWITVDGRERADYEVVVMALHRLRLTGKRYLLRTGPGMLAPLAGQPVPPPLSLGELRTNAPTGSQPLIVVGSHVELTTRQVHELSKRHDLAEIEIDVTRVDDAAYVDALAVAAATRLRDRPLLICTSRTLHAADTPERSLALSRRVSSAVNRVTGRALAAGPRYVLAKGGITSHEVARTALGIRAGTIVGQLFTGQVSVLLPDDAPHGVRGLPYVIFPGNVGDESSLADAVDRMNALTT